MEDPSYAFGVFTKHFGRVQFAKRSGFIGLELGPGDSLASAVIANALGASTYYLIDSGDFAQKDANIYKNVAAFLEQQGLPAPKLDRITSWQEVLQICNATYETAGLASLKGIATGSVDYIWSHGVLQSVRRAEFFETLLELRRILRDDGASSQLIDLTDLVALALNHLRFPESLWESGILANCGIYSNRYRYSQMVTMFQKAGFSVDVVEVKRWSHLPTPRYKLHPQFRGMPDEELLVMGFAVVLRPAVTHARSLNKPDSEQSNQHAKVSAIRMESN
jgi:hypothetical protein